MSARSFARAKAITLAKRGLSLTQPREIHTKWPGRKEVKRATLIGANAQDQIGALHSPHATYSPLVDSNWPMSG